MKKLAKKVVITSLIAGLCLISVNAFAGFSLSIGINSPGPCICGHSHLSVPDHIAFIHSHYDVPPGQIRYWMAAGYSPGDICMAVRLGRSVHQPYPLILRDYSTHRDRGWTYVTTLYAKKPLYSSPYCHQGCSWERRPAYSGNHKPGGRWAGHFASRPWR